MQMKLDFESKITRRDKKRKPKMKIHGKSVFETKKLRSKNHDSKRISKRS